MGKKDAIHIYKIEIAFTIDFKTKPNKKEELVERNVALI